MPFRLNFHRLIEHLNVNYQHETQSTNFASMVALTDCPQIPARASDEFMIYQFKVGVGWASQVAWGA